MKAYELSFGGAGAEASLTPCERAEPKPGPREALVRVRATSLNYRDLAIRMGTYPGVPNSGTLVPLSDGAGEIVETGSDVTRFKKGDRVAATFFQTWVAGRPDPVGPRRMALGGPGKDGMLAEYVAIDEDGLVAIPDGYSFEGAATLPCAAVTAWNALMVTGRPIMAGDSVLTLGTGGVSMFALQFAHAAGARVVATSSSDAKLERAHSHGATDLINYKTYPEWGQEVVKRTGGRGVDAVVEIGGAGTLGQSMQAVGFGGKIGLIGFLGGPKGDANPAMLMRRGGSLHGIFVGSRAMFEDMLQAMVVNNIKPIIDKTFAFEDAAEAYAYQKAGKHFGKVVITL